MQMLRITKAKDPLMWYADLIGDLVPYCGQWRDAYKSLEPAGFLNRVEFADAEIVTLHPDGRVEPSASTGYVEQCNQVTLAIRDLSGSADEAVAAMREAAQAMNLAEKPYYRRLEGRRW